MHYITCTVTLRACVYMYMYWIMCVYVHLCRSCKWLLPEARVGGHGYSSLSVCLFVCRDSESAHLAAIALRLHHG